MFLQIISLLKCILPLGAAMALKIFSRMFILREIVSFINDTEEVGSSVSSLSPLMIAGAATISQFLVSALMALSERMHQSEGATLVEKTQQKLLRKSLKVSFEPGEGWNGLNRSDLSRMINQESTQLTTYYQAVAFIFVFPFSISQPLYVLYCKLGWYSFVVIAVLLTIFYLSSRYTRGMGASMISAQEQLKKRSALVQSISENMRYVRGSNLEQIFYEKLEKVREIELQHISKLFFMQDAKLFFLKLSQPISMAAIFLYFIFIQPSVIDIELLYTLEQSFWAIRSGLGQYPKFVFIYLTQSRILQRFKVFLTSQEISQRLKIEDTCNKLLLHCPDAAPSVNIQAHEGQIIVVKGPTGSGKTALLQGLLGELGGIISKWENIGSVGQDNWLKEDTLRQNITLQDGSSSSDENDEDWFGKIVNAFELQNDFSSFEKVISATSDNISGGQKQRICLARAFYKKANKLILLDDSFCSLDRKVMSRILSNIRRFLLEDRIVVIAVSSSDLVESAADVIVQLSADHNVLAIQETNRVFEVGTPITENDTQNGLGSNEATSKDEMKSETVKLDQKEQENQIDQESFESLITQQTDESTGVVESTIDSQSQSSGHSSDNTVPPESQTSSNSGAAFRFLRSVKQYACIDPGVTKYLILAIISISAYNCFYFFENYILMNWNILTFLSQGSKIQIYLAVTVLGSLSQILRLVFAKKQAIIASRTVHRLACRTLLQADFQEYLDQNITPHRFTDTLTTQLYGLDYFLGLEMSSFIFQLASLFNAIVLTLYGSIRNVTTLLSVGGFLVMGLKLSQRRVSDQETVSREIRKAEEPLASFVQESLKGLVTIRSFHLEEQTIKHYITLQNNKRKWSQYSYTQDFKRDLELAVLTLFVNFMSLWSSLSGSTPQAAISKVSSNSQIDQNTLASVKMCNQLSGYLSSFHFVMEYLSTLKQQKPLQITQTKDNTKSKNTQNQGASIEFEDYSAAYSQTAFTNRVFALKNISMKITEGEKVCIIGRTGSGKSSLVFSILQLFGYSDGKIKIGGELMEGSASRNLVEVIQQDSPIFEGTVRQNIDPKGIFSSDESLMVFMKSQHLEELLLESGISLSTNLTEGGKNLSSGQFQLIGFVRALLQEKPILIFDEANSKIDANLETKIFESLFKRQATVIFISHRLGLVHKFQRIVCMDDGNIVEDGRPDELLEKPNSYFGKLIRSKINELN